MNIYEPIELINKEDFPSKLLKNFLDTLEEDFLFYKNYRLIDAKGVYTNNIDLFSPQLVNGRNFITSDFINNTNVCIVNEKIKNQLYIDQVNLFCSIENTSPLVIGSFNNYSLEKKNNSNLYFNLFSQEVTNKSTLGGEYIFDATIHSQSIVNNLINYLKEINPNIIIKTKSIKEFYSSSTFITLTDEYLTLSIIIITLLLLIINLFQSLEYWLLSKKNEIFSRILSGSPKNKIITSLFNQYLLILLTSFLLGGGSSLTIINMSNHLAIPIKIQLFSNVITILLFIIIGGVFGGFYIIRILNNNPILLRRNSSFLSHYFMQLKILLISNHEPY